MGKIYAGRNDFSKFAFHFSLILHMVIGETRFGVAGSNR
jgi:hypothetical protein